MMKSEFTLIDSTQVQPRWTRVRDATRYSTIPYTSLYELQMPVDVLEELFSIMASLPQHQFQILTKRAQRLASLAPAFYWPPNVWVGVSIENQEYAARASFLRQAPAQIRFVSAEPLIGPLELDLSGIHWVIVGGESQRGCRPFNLDWARRILEQCRAAGVAYFLQQLGGYPNRRDRLEQFPADLRIREYPDIKPGDQLPEQPDTASPSQWPDRPQGPGVRALWSEPAVYLLPRGFQAPRQRIALRGFWTGLILTWLAE
jgi:protein gp37